MNSIDKQQPEDNRDNLQGKEAVEKIKELVDSAKTCFFCTNIATGKPFDTRPMAVQKVDEQGAIWFLSSVDSHKNEEIQKDNMVQLLFQGDPHTDFLSVYGRATVSKDKQKIKEFWNPMLKTWFTEGEDDPRITVIKVDMESGYYWDTKHGKAVSFAKQIIGAMTGQTLDDSVQGELKA